MYMQLRRPPFFFLPEQREILFTWRCWFAAREKNNCLYMQGWGGTFFLSLFFQLYTVPNEVSSLPYFDISTWKHYNLPTTINSGRKTDKVYRYHDDLDYFVFGFWKKECLRPLAPL